MPCTPHVYWVFGFNVIILYGHCFATHLLNEGKNVFEIKRLLGHVRIDTTTWYLQLSDSEVLKLLSPLDTMKNDEIHG